MHLHAYLIDDGIISALALVALSVVWTSLSRVKTSMTKTGDEAVVPAAGVL